MDAGLVGRKFGMSLGVPQRYGLSAGELAMFVNNEWLSQPVKLRVIPYQKGNPTWVK